VAQKRRSFTVEYKREVAKEVVESSRPVATVAREQGLNEQTVRNWVNDYRKKHATEEPPLTLSQASAAARAEERKSANYAGTRNSWKKPQPSSRRTTVNQRDEFIEAEKDTMTETGERKYTITTMCTWLGVSTSGYDAWRTRPVSATTQRHDYVARMVGQAVEMSEETDGYRRIHAQLARWGETCTPELVRRILRERGLLPCQPRPWRHSLTDADPAAGPIPDLLGRDITAQRPGEKMVGDITYIPTWEGWVYLATVIDRYSTSVIGWAMDDNYKTPLIEAAIWMAARNGDLPPGAIFHSDRGSNYTSQQFGRTLESLGIRQSVGRTGICYDNSMAESFSLLSRTNASTVPCTPPASTPWPILLATSNCATIPNVFTQGWTTRPHTRSTPNT
jgi:putative transposase